MIDLPVYTSDMVTCDDVTRERTEEGYLKITAKAGRSGILKYSCKQMGFKDVNGTGYVNVLRHPDDAFNEKSLETLQGKDITFRHPEGGVVNPTNFSQLSKGVVLTPGIRVTGDNGDDDIYVTGIIKDQTTIDALEDGFKGVSLGYKAFYAYAPGEWNGVKYHYRQFNIRYNHLALVLRGRAGKDYTVLDHEDFFMDEQEKAAFKKEILDGVKTTVSELLAPTAPASPTPGMTLDEMDSAVQRRTEIIEKAKKIKPGISTEGLTDMAIMRNCLGDKVTNDHSDDVIKYAFDSLSVTEPTKGEPRGHKPMNLSQHPSEKTTLDAEEVIEESKRRFKANTNRGFESLIKQLANKG
ncbi:DUF2213 domain-containing protein [Vibrio parahaemolyticus]|nr:DUF2213 domain-containing protein [Vibrio parahaemolyticus]